MKKIKLNAARLQLNKQKIMDLTHEEMHLIRGGATLAGCMHPTTTVQPTFRADCAEPTTTVQKTHDNHCAQPTTTVQPTHLCVEPSLVFCNQ